MVFLGTFDTARENRKFTLEIGDKTLRLRDLLIGPFLVLPVFLVFSIVIFVLEIIVYKHIIKYRLFNNVKKFSTRSRKWTIHSFIHP